MKLLAENVVTEASKIFFVMKLGEKTERPSWAVARQ